MSKMRKEKFMSNKWITRILLVCTVCLIILGGIFKSAANNQQGVTMYTGAMINGKYNVATSGTIGGNAEKYEILNTNGTLFFLLAGVTGIACVVTFIAHKKK